MFMLLCVFEVSTPANKLLGPNLDSDNSWKILHVSSVLFYMHPFCMLYSRFQLLSLITHSCLMDYYISLILINFLLYVKRLEH